MFFKNKGFTLIELLVVISIIGLLSSIVVASLNTSRVRASDVAIKADLKGIATSAEAEASNMDGRYNTTGIAVTSSSCSTLGTPNTILQNPNIQSAMKHIKATNGGQDVFCNISADGTSYSMTGPLSVNTGDSVYMDNTGNFVSGKSDSAIISSFANLVLNSVCPSNCPPNLDFNKDLKISGADRLIILSLSLQTLTIYNNVFNGITAETNSKIGTSVTVGSAFDPDRTGTVTSLDLARIQAALVNKRNP